MNPCSIHAYVWLPAWTTEGGRMAVARAAAAGYDRMTVPMRSFEEIEPASIARMFEAAGLQPVNSANQLPDADLSSTDPAVRRRGIDRLRHALRLARDMGSRHVGGVLYGVLDKAARAATADNLAAAADSLALLADEAGRSGIRLALEIVNRYESNAVNTVAQGLDLLRRIGADNVHLHLDTFHMNIEEDDVAGAIAGALPHLAVFELDQNHRGRLDRGHIDLAALLRPLLDAGYRDVIAVEAFSSSISGPEVAGGVAIWRPHFDDGDEVAIAGRELIARVSAEARG